MSNSKLLLLFILGLLIICIAVVSSCEKSPTDGGMEFQAGTYAGTYQVQRNAYDPPKVDTMKFIFYGGGGFFMLKDTVIVDVDTLYDWDRQFCNVSGEFDIIGSNDRIRITIPEDFAYYNTCVHEENPSDDYSRSYMGDWIVFSGADGDFDRKIVLWGLMEN